MNREDVVRISKLYMSEGLSTQDIALVLSSYCIEHGKRTSDTQMFVSYLIQNRFLLAEYFREALEFYEKKFFIEKLYSKPDRLGNNRLITIY